jgi:hypothetical protein
MAPLAYRPLKVGKIRLYERLFDQRQFQADGLGGHMYEFLPVSFEIWGLPDALSKVRTSRIKQGSWTGKGNVNYSDLNEGTEMYAQFISLY